MNPGSDGLSPFVRWCEIDGIVFVLDLNTDMFSALTASLSASWIDFAHGGEPDGALDDILCARRWRASDVTEPQRYGSLRPVVSIRIPLLRAITCLARARENLRKCGLSATVSWAKQHKPVTVRVSPEKAIAAFRTADGLLPNRKGDRDCLPRSLGLFAMLRGYGFLPCHKIGLYRYPFDAHAWIELDGKAVLERRPLRDDGASSSHNPARTIILQST